MRRKLRTQTVIFASTALVLGLASGAFAQNLSHRYSFNEPAGSLNFTDSIGGFTWTGTLQGTAALDGANLVLDGLGSYGALPEGLITGYTAVSVEFWADLGPGNPTWTRVFTFGDQNGSGGKNSGVDYCHYAGGDWQNLDVLSTNGVDAFANNPGGLEGAVNAHVTVVVDPINNTMYYYNGSHVASDPVLNNGAGGTVSPLANMNDTLNVIGMSPFTADRTLVGSIHEFRVYSGVIAPRQVALNDSSGPDSIVSDPGPIQALHFSSPVNPLLVNQLSQQVLTGDFTNLMGVNMILYGGVNFTSQNTSILTVNSNGVVRGVGPGTTKVVASFGGLSATNTLTVIAVPAALAHRYSFTADASDSVGGANGTNMGNAVISGGQVVLDGSFGTYVDLPAGAINISNYTAATFEAWVTFGNQSLWAYLFGFGNTVGGNGVGQIACVPCVGNQGSHHWGITENFGGGRTTSWAHAWSNLTAHVTCVVDPPTGTISIYRDGVLEFAEYDAAAPLSNVPTNFAYLGRSFYDADPYLNVSIDEFRIYSGALSPAQVALTHRNGTGSTSIDVGALSSIVVVPTNYPAFATLIPPVVLANYANLSGFNLLPTPTASGNAALGGPQGLVVTSSDPTVISVNSQNMLTTHRPGTVTLSASYQGKTSSAIVRVSNLATLTHRYSFTDDASDSIGGANGTFIGNATNSAGQLQLTGVNSDYLELPAGLLQDYDSVTIDTWANLGAAQSWARLWEFCDLGPATENEFYFSPGWNSALDGSFYNAGFPYPGGNIFSGGGAFGNQALHVTCTYGDGSMEIYTNGVLQGSRSSASMIAPANQAGINSSSIGHSPFNDPGINGSVDEFRIYRGKLSAEEVAASQVLGPDVLLSILPPTLSASKAGANVLLSWPVAAAGFAVEASSDLSTWTTLSTAPTLVGTTWQLSVPASGTARFFRLVK